MNGSQRDRVLEGVIRAVAAHGYAATEVEDIIAAAGVPDYAFHEHFTGKEDAFLTTYDRIVELLAAQVAEAYADEGDWPAKIARALDSLLGLLAGDPALAYAFIVELPTAGPEGPERRARTLKRFREFLTPQPHEVPGSLENIPHVIGEALTGGIYEMIYVRVVEGRAAELPELLPDALHTILLPFFGPGGAAEVCARTLAAEGLDGSGPAGSAT